MMPKNKLAWAAWNYNIDNRTNDPVTLTYNMNILQNIETKDPLLVTLNPNKAIDEDKIIKKLTYTHPKFSLDSIVSQKKHTSISGKNRTGYAGAYWGNGFHEDGVKSAYEATQHFNAWLD
jgi:predicted NAD/FAD-binding protein